MKTIKFDLDTQSITKAIKELNAYRESLTEKARYLQSRIAEVVYWNVKTGFSVAVADDIYVGGEPQMADVTVDVDDSGDITVIFASGEDAVFVEFGAGVYHNPYPLGSPHPMGAEYGLLIGSYGKGQGLKNQWAIPGSTRKEPVLTHGTPAAMPMYKGVEEAVTRIRDLAREVFADD